jgi:hypothetical protein
MELTLPNVTSGRLIKKRKNRVATLKLWSLLWAVYISRQRQSVDNAS